MTCLPTLEDIAEQLEAQDAELARTARLVESIPDDFTISQSALEAFDELTEPPATLGSPLVYPGIRA